MEYEFVKVEKTKKQEDFELLIDDFTNISHDVSAIFLPDWRNEEKPDLGSIKKHSDRVKDILNKIENAAKEF